MLRGRWAVLCTAVDACPLAGGEAPECDKTGGCGFVEGATGVVGGQVFAIEGVRRGAADHAGVALVKLEADGAGYGLLGFVDEGIEGRLQGGEPQAFVGELCVALFDGGFEAENVP